MMARKMKDIDTEEELVMCCTAFQCQAKGHTLRGGHRADTRQTFLVKTKNLKLRTENKKSARSFEKLTVINFSTFSSFLHV